MSDTEPTVVMSLDNNQGYGPDQVNTEMTLRDLLHAVEDAIAEHGLDARVVTKDSGNRYGARWGRIDADGDLFTLHDTTGDWD
ncbi:hypothetical protein SEA_FUNSIZED_23 [Mycobacterium phage Funsized]|nr:hypothetical protein SEA_FUNSIZED_23 [Mycobacterium phage Funsized]